MYSGEGGVYVSGGKCERRRKAGFAWKKENALRCVGEKISVRLRVLRMYVCMVL